jgi:S-adenosylmethionine hydrolase
VKGGSVRRVVVISDCTDIAFAEMRGAILAAAGQDVPIEPLVPVFPFSVVNTGFVLRLMAEAYRESVVLCFIMNSIATRTERIIGSTQDGKIIFEGTNTGAAMWLIEDLGCSELYELHDPGFVPFGGKFVHSPAVGRAATGVPIAQLGNPFPLNRVRDISREAGTIVHIDNFGNGKFTGTFPSEAPRLGERLRVRIGDETLSAVWGRRMMELADGDWVVYPGSSLGLLEIGQVRSSGLNAFDIAPGERIDIDGYGLTDR